MNLGQKAVRLVAMKLPTISLEILQTPYSDSTVINALQII